MAPLSPSLLMLTPFVLLLTAIAVGPLWFSTWWARHYPKVVGVLSGVVVLYYVFGLQATAELGETLHEYVSFIILIGSLFVVSGGIHIDIQGKATPASNVLFLLIGAVAANLLGTTGASMLLIRPWLRLNRARGSGHHLVFFIFIVANVGGCLTPIGDPPLFLGYLSGVPFWWVTVHCLPMWCVGVGLLLAAFFIIDCKSHLQARKQFSIAPGNDERWRIRGGQNFFFLAVILGAALLSRPPFLRESLMLAAVFGSYYTTAKSVHEANHFNWGPIREVAILFAGLFATMMPALDWLQLHASKIGHATPAFFYFGSGGLSSVLDNAPTYLCFLKTIRTLDPVSHPFTTDYLTAISVGAVFFGAATYIGNGPNLMVKAIAEEEKVNVPNFLAYIFNYTFPFLLPMLLIVGWLFFRG